MADNDMGVSSTGPQVAVLGHYGPLEVTKIDSACVFLASMFFRKGWSK